MEDISTLWTFQESMEELKQKLHCMTYELEMTKKKANEDMGRNEEQIKKLLQLLQAAFKERDEAKAELTKLQQLIPFPNNNIKQQPNFDQLMPFSPDTPLFSNSGFTDSQSQSLSHVSSPVSSDSTSILNTLKLKPDTTQKMIQFQPNKPLTVTDDCSLMIERLAKGRPLPQKGRLLEAVLGAGPTLQTLMVAGALPRWRNPPAPLPHHHIPPVDFKSTFTTHNSPMVNGFGNPSVNTCNYGQNLQDFGSGSSGSNCFMAVGFDYQIAKRQRIQ